MHSLQVITQHIRTLCVALFALFISSIALAADMNTPAGLWKAHNDEGVPTGYIRIVALDGVYTGVIEKGLDENQAEQFCTACKGARKDQKLIGMTIIKNVKAKGDYFAGDEILDPFSGNTYRVKLKLIDGGRQMEVRGYIGLSIFGRTQQWERINDGQ